MNISEFAKVFFNLLDQRFGPFDRPFQFHVFPFDAGGSLNFLTVGLNEGQEFVTYVSWDLFGHEQQKRGSLGRYEFVVDCDSQDWCLDVITKIGRQSLQEVINPGDTFDIGPWVGPDKPLQGVVFEQALRTELAIGPEREACGLLRCIGVTRPELEFAMTHGTSELVEHLRRAEIYPRTIVGRQESVALDS